MTGPQDAASAAGPRGCGNTAYLRVYQPLAAFEPPERARWERYATESGSTPLMAAVRRERADALHAMIVGTLDVAVEHALVERTDGLLYVCPLRTQLRVWEALGEFRSRLPSRVADAFVPSLVAGAAEAELSRWRLRDPGLHAPVLSTTWRIPVAWFCLVEGSERQLVLAGSSRSLRYRTSMSNARRRAARALQVLTRSLPDAPVVPEVRRLGRWLEEFHPRSRLELDYADLVHLRNDAELREDVSAEDVGASLAALLVGDSEAAGQAYERVSERWRPLANLDNAS